MRALVVGAGSVGGYFGGRRLRECAMILPILNGMRHMDTLRARFGARALLGGVARVSTQLDERGRILDQSGFHDLVYARGRLRISRAA